MTTPDPTTLGILVTSIGGLTTAIGVLWKTVLSHFRSIEERLAQCEDDRSRLWETLARETKHTVDDLKSGNKGRSK